MATARLAALACFGSASLLALLTACSTHMKQTPAAVVAIPAVPQPPVAAKKPYQVVSANGSREDEYYWLQGINFGVNWEF